MKVQHMVPVSGPVSCLSETAVHAYHLSSKSAYQPDVLLFIFFLSPLDDEAEELSKLECAFSSSRIRTLASANSTFHQLVAAHGAAQLDMKIRSTENINAHINIAQN